MSLRVSICAMALVATIAAPARSASAQETTVTITSRILGTDRIVHVRLPDSYANSSDAYPVLYMLDGDMIDRLAPLLESLVDEGAVPEMIIIAIPHADRGHDLTPTAEARVRNSGGGKLFFRFIADELIPYVDRTYRTQPFKVLYGHSLAGLFVAYALAAEPGLFAGYIASSPTIHWDDWVVRQLAAETFAVPADWEAHLYMSVGIDDIPTYIPATREFADWLETNAPKGLTWSYRVYEGEDHESVVPVALADGLAWVFDRSGRPAKD